MTNVSQFWLALGPVKFGHRTWPRKNLPVPDGRAGQLASQPHRQPLWVNIYHFVCIDPKGPSQRAILGTQRSWQAVAASGVGLRTLKLADIAQDGPNEMPVYNKKKHMETMSHCIIIAMLPAAKQTCRCLIQAKTGRGCYSLYKYFLAPKN